MALVEYSDSDSSPNEVPAMVSRAEIGRRLKAGITRKRKRENNNVHGPGSVPALPQNFHSLYASNVRTSMNDDPSLHAGRKRQVPHIQGNWPTHAYLECEYCLFYTYTQ